MTTAEFQAEFLSHATPPIVSDPRQIVAEYVETRRNTIRQATSLGIGREGTKEARTKLARAFVRRWMMLRFAAIDLSFADRPWWVTARRSNGENTPKIVAASSEKPTGDIDPVTTCVGRISRFFSVYTSPEQFALNRGEDADIEAIGKSNTAIRLGTLSSGRRGSDSYRRVDVTVWAKVPDGICARHVRLVRKALAHYRLADALTCEAGIPLTEEVQSQNGRWTNRSGYPDSLIVLWAPLPEALAVEAEPPRPNGDPAVVVRLGGETFLLDFYDTPDEAPIEHLIREFSEGKLPKC